MKRSSIIFNLATIGALCACSQSEYISVGFRYREFNFTYFNSMYCLFSFKLHETQPADSINVEVFFGYRADFFTNNKYLHSMVLPMGGSFEIERTFSTTREWLGDPVYTPMEDFTNSDKYGFSIKRSFPLFGAEYVEYAFSYQDAFALPPLPEYTNTLGIHYNLIYRPGGSSELIMPEQMSEEFGFYPQGSGFCYVVENGQATFLKQ